MIVLDVAVAALAMVLVVSGVLKVRDPEASASMLAAIGLPSGREAVYAVAAAELVVGAAALVIGGTVATAALTALYGAFAVVAAVLVRSNADVTCGCFGRRSAEMTTLHVGVDVVAVLVGIGAIVAGASGLSSAVTDRPVWVLVVALAAAVGLAAVVVVLLTVVPRRSTARRSPPSVSLAPEGRSTSDGSGPAAAPGRGTGVTALHPLIGRTPTGEPLEIAVAGTGRVTLLAFLTTGCPTCLHFWQHVAEPGGGELPGDRSELVVVVRGEQREDPERVRDLAGAPPGGPVVISSDDAWRDYGVAAGPYFVLLDGGRDRVLGEGTASAWTEIEALVRQAVGSSRSAGVAE